MNIRNMLVDGEIEYEMITLPMILLSITYFFLIVIIFLIFDLIAGDWDMLLVILPILILSVIPSIIKAYKIGRRVDEGKKIKTILIIIDTTFKMLIFSTLIVYLIAILYKVFGGHTGDMGFGFFLFFTVPLSLVAGPISGAYLAHILKKQKGVIIFN